MGTIPSYIALRAITFSRSPHQ